MEGHSLSPVKITLRKAVAADIPALRQLIEASVLGLQAQDYTPAQLEKALRTVYGVDSQLIADGTYYVAEAPIEPGEAQADSPHPAATIVGCGGWSKRKTLYGGDCCAGREDDLLDPQSDAAKIRAFFVHPAWARRGVGGMILDACERAARAAGFTSFEMGSTLTGVSLYRTRGYAELEPVDIPLGEGETLRIIHMKKSD